MLRIIATLLIFASVALPQTAPTVSAVALVVSPSMSNFATLTEKPDFAPYVLVWVKSDADPAKHSIAVMIYTSAGTKEFSLPTAPGWQSAQMPLEKGETVSRVTVGLVRREDPVPATLVQ